MKSHFFACLSFFLIGTCFARVVAMSAATNYTIAANNKYRSASTPVDIKVLADPGLAGLTLSSGSLNPAFATGTLSYTASVSSAKTAITVTPTTNDPTATIKVNGTAVSSGTASANIPLVAGSNAVAIVVTAQDGITTKTYTVTVTRPSTNAYLSHISLSPSSTLTTTTGPGYGNYTTTIPSGEASVQVIATVQDATAKITVNGSAVASGTASAAIPLSVGANNITIVSTAQDGVTTKTYYITATTRPSTNAYLSHISLSPSSTLTTTTGPGYGNYTTTIPSGEASVQVIATVQDATAKITVNGSAVASGTASAAIPLSVGANNITIVSTAQDGVTTKTYYITATTRPSTNAYLSHISLSPSSTLTTTTGPGYGNYTTAVPNTEAGVQVIATEQDASATIKVNGTAVASGTASAVIPLSVGANNIIVISTAQDGVTTKTYYITVTRAASSALVINNNTVNNGPTDSQPLNVVVYPSPSSGFAKGSDKYAVSVTQNGITQQSYVYETTAGTSGTQWSHNAGKHFHFTTFSFANPVTVTVTKFNSNATSAIVRPSRLVGNVNTVISGSNRTVTFTLSKPAKVSVEFNDDNVNFNDALAVFGDSLENVANVPSITASNVYLANTSSNASSLSSIPSTKTVVYFPPGVYTLGGKWSIPSTVQQVYIAGGAYVKGYLYWTAPKNTAPGIKINGRGILSNEGFSWHYPAAASDGNTADWFFAVSLTMGKGNLVEGITVIEPSAYNIFINATNSTISNVNINGFQLNNDGLTFGGSGMVITNCFIRTSDDAIVPYASNVQIDNNTFWQLSGSVLQLGWTPHTLSNISVNNCDVLHAVAIPLSSCTSATSDSNVGFINAMNQGSTTQAAVVSNVTVSNVWFDTPILRFLDIRGDRLGKFTTYANPWQYANFNIANIYFAQTTSVAFPLIYVHGYDASHLNSNFTFKNMYFNNSPAIVATLLTPAITHQFAVNTLVMQ